MKLITLGVAAALAVGSIGLACAAPNLIQNGGFSGSNRSAPWQFGTDSAGGSGGFFGGGSCSNLGTTITDWTGNGGYEIWYPDATQASGTEPCSTWHGEEQLLSANITAPPAGAGTNSFVGLDGIMNDTEPHASISQTVGGLVNGASYTVSFWWGNTQLQNRGGNTYEQLQVSMDGNLLYQTANNEVGAQAFSGWHQQTFTFTYTGTGGVLQFLSIGTPNGSPPFAVLTGISVNQNVPEPPELAMFGLGLLGLGLLTVFARRRALRRNGEGDLG